MMAADLGINEKGPRQDREEFFESEPQKTFRLIKHYSEQ
jgi:hypothetical protein